MSELKVVGARDKNSVMCLVQAEGVSAWEYMRAYDQMPPEARRMIDTAPFKMCVLCVEAEAAGENHVRVIRRFLAMHAADAPNF